MLPRAVGASIRVRRRGHGCEGETVTVMQSFELQVYKGGKWEFDSYFDDRETALFEATRLHDYNRYNGIRVLEEIFRDDSDTSDCTVIFSRLRKIENQGGGGNSRTRAPREANRTSVRKATQPGQEQKTKSRTSSKTKSRKKGKTRSAGKSRRSSGSKSPTSLNKLTVMAVVILIIGVGTMVGLRYVADLM